MAAPFDDSFLDFAFNFDQCAVVDATVSSSTSNRIPGRFSKKNQIMLTKAKTLSMHKLFNLMKIKRSLIEEKDRELIVAKDECKQICLDYKTVMERCSQLEKNAELLQIKNVELEVQFTCLENRCAAVQSHSNQLQSLVQEYETKMTALKIEIQMEKAKGKDGERNVLKLMKEKGTLLRYLSLVRDALYGRRKLTRHEKLILEKYRRKMRNSCEETIDEGLEFDDPFADVPETLSVTDEFVETTRKVIDTDLFAEPLAVGTNDSLDRFSDYSNGISVDTGRGSSIESEGFLSPEYYIADSPCCTDNLSDSKKVADVGTSTISAIETADRTTSPMPGKRTAQKSTSPMPVEITHRSISPIHFADTAAFSKLVDISTSPIMFEENTDILASAAVESSYSINIPKILIDRAVSPIETCSVVEIKTPVKNVVNCGVSPIPMDLLNVPSNAGTGHYQDDTYDDKISKESTVLESNSIVAEDDNGSDCEVQMILSTMRMSHDLITPIPPTPRSIRKLSKSVPNASDDSTNSIIHLQNNTNATVLLTQVKAMLTRIFGDAKSCMGAIKSLEKLVVKGSCIPEDGRESCANNVQEDGDDVDSRDCAELSDLEPDKKKELHCESVEEIAREIQRQSEQIARARCVTCDHAESRVCDNLEPNPNVTALQQENNESLEVIEQEYEFVEEASENKRQKCKKLSKLEKLRSRLLPKSKIRRCVTSLSRKLRTRPQVDKKEMGIIKRPSNLSNNVAYEEAVKIMAEIRTNQNKNKNSKEDTVAFKDNESTTKIDIKKVNDVDISTPPAKGINPLKKSPINTKSESEPPQIKKRGKRAAFDNAEEQNKRVLRSSALQSDAEKAVVNKTISTRKNKQSKISTIDTADSSIITPSLNDTNNNENDNADLHNYAKINMHDNANTTPENGNKIQAMEAVQDTSVVATKQQNAAISYGDMDIFTDGPPPPKKQRTDEKSKSIETVKPEESVLCVSIQKHGRMNPRNRCKKMPEKCPVIKKFEEGMSKISPLPMNETKPAMDKFVDEIKTWDIKSFLAAFMKYLSKHERKEELFNLISAPPAPPMTKSEQILLYIVLQLKTAWPHIDIYNCVFDNIEYTLFKLNHTPDFEVIETMSHFYAILCRYIKAKSRLRLFIMDAMYCIQFKSIPLIKQCINVWLHVLPLPHMGIAKTPLVTCLVYLLHFYKCDDKFNRVKELRFLLQKKYNYQISEEWTETKILEMFKHAIIDCREIMLEKKMLRIALVILAKRQGPRWCQNKIIKGILQPMIEKEDVPIRVKQFCITLIGPLMKPYPMDMKVYREIMMNQLIDLLEKDPHQKIQEAIIISLIYMSKQNQNRVIQTLLTWKPEVMSAELNEMLRVYVQEKPFRVWKKILSKISLTS